MTAKPDDDWLRKELEDMTTEELFWFRIGLDRYLRRHGLPKTRKGQAVHHVNGDPYDHRPENLRIVNVSENRRQKP